MCSTWNTRFEDSNASRCASAEVFQMSSDPTARPGSLHTCCSHCGGLLTLQFEPLTATGSQPSSHVQPFVCPYCLKKNDEAFPALLKWVWKGHRE